jgi:Family of unknown function (DUF5947)
MSDARAVTAALSSLRRFARGGGRRGEHAATEHAADERCELCAAAVTSAHEHLLDPRARQLKCACGACAILFGDGTQLVRVTPRAERLGDDFRLDDATWHALGVPIALAFFVRSGGRLTAFYPGPAGAIEAAPSAHAWDALVAANPRLAALRDDVEALLVHRLGTAREHWLVSIDVCYRLVGRLRAHRGAADEVARFFAELGGASCPT